MVLGAKLSGCLFTTDMWMIGSVSSNSLQDKEKTGIFHQVLRFRLFSHSAQQLVTSPGTSASVRRYIYFPAFPLR